MKHLENVEETKLLRLPGVNRYGLLFIAMASLNHMRNHVKLLLKSGVDLLDQNQTSLMVRVGVSIIITTDDFFYKNR